MATKQRKGRRPPKRNRPTPAPSLQPLLDRIRCLERYVERWDKIQAMKDAAEQREQRPGITRMNLDIHSHIYEHLCELSRTGLFGNSPEETAERIICDHFKSMLRAVKIPATDQGNG